MIDWLEEVLNQAGQGVDLLQELQSTPVIVGQTVRDDREEGAEEAEAAPSADDMLSAQPTAPYRGEMPLWAADRAVQDEVPLSVPHGGEGRSALNALYRSILPMAPLSVPKGARQGQSWDGALCRAVRDAVSASPFRTEGRTVVIREEQETSPGLTVRELDRTVRRDSRRYDGEMSIY